MTETLKSACFRSLEIPCDRDTIVCLQFVGELYDVCVKFWSNWMWYFFYSTLIERQNHVFSSFWLKKKKIFFYKQTVSFKKKFDCKFIVKRQQKHPQFIKLLKISWFKLFFTNNISRSSIFLSILALIFFKTNDFCV